jgi:hypothetical protein
MFRSIKTTMICGAWGVVGTVLLLGVCFLLAATGVNTVGLLFAPGRMLAPLVNVLPASLLGVGSGSSSVGSSLGLLALSALVGWFVVFSLLAFVVLRARMRRRGT